MTKRLLIVDDNDLVRKGLSRYLSGRGWLVTTAATHTQARDYYNSVDVVITDWNLYASGGGGDLVMKECPVPVVLHSSDFGEQDTDLLRQYRTKTFAVLRKPAPPDQLDELCKTLKDIKDANF